MKISGIGKFKVIACKTILGIILPVLITCVSAVPGFGDDNRMGHERGRYEQRGRGYDRDRHMQGRHYGYYGHQERGYYPPPPVFFVPPPPPGIGIFFPPIIIHP